MKAKQKARVSGEPSSQTGKNARAMLVGEVMEAFVGHAALKLLRDCFEEKRVDKLSRDQDQVDHDANEKMTCEKEHK